ncbi:MAG: ABC transporter substrate-binding protein [Carboxylicivirga sp.]|jgi:iron complex transport system substrate-binding protein|nr:ABC transporter substrate-binding protein [Carboxylicivirga sp.]
MNRITILTVLMLSLLAACQGKRGSKSSETSVMPDSTYVPRYAKGFTINYFKDYHQIVLNDPWGDSSKQETIALLKKPERLNELKQSNDYVLNFPVKRWIALSSTMVSYADILDTKSTICGVAEPQYIKDEYIQSQLKAGAIKSVGMAVSPDVEIMVDMEPELMMVSPFKDNHFEAVKSAGIAVVTNADYLEVTPLGRAEWMVFVGELLGKGELAKRLFNDMAYKYESIRQLAARVKTKPGVFTGHIYQGIWHTPAGESYMANFFKDAGADYVYKDSKGTGSLFLDYETVLDKAEKTKYWLMISNQPNGMNYNTIKNMDARYEDFGAFKNQQIIATNSAHSLYFEKGVLQPQVVLKDLVYHFHPELLPNYQPVYFKHLTEN